VTLLVNPEVLLLDLVPAVGAHCRPVAVLGALGELQRAVVAVQVLHHLIAEFTLSDILHGVVLLLVGSQVYEPNSTDVALCLEFLVCILNVPYRLVVARKTPLAKRTVLVCWDQAAPVEDLEVVQHVHGHHLQVTRPAR